MSRPLAPDRIDDAIGKAPHRNRHSRLRGPAAWGKSGCSRIAGAVGGATAAGGSVPVLDERDSHPLVAVYLARRVELVRYFRIRLRSEAAAEDLVQDIYVKIAGLPPEDIGNPAAYLYRLGTNLMLDRLKQQTRSARRDADWREAETISAGGEDIAQTPPADEALAARQRLEQIIETVNALPPPVKEAFRLHKLEGLTHAETATAMGISRSSVEKHIMASLRRILAKVGR